MSIRKTLVNLDKVLGTKPKLPSYTTKIRKKPKKPEPEPVITVPKIDKTYWELAEVVNGRMATLGQGIAPYIYYTKGLTLVDQVTMYTEPALILSIIFGAYITLTSYMTFPLYDKNGRVENVELLIGQSSMLLWIIISFQLLT